MKQSNNQLQLFPNDAKGQNLHIPTDPKPVREFFLRLTPERRQQWKKRYEKLLDTEQGADRRIIKSYDGRERSINITKMPWMISAWENGLKILNELIEKLDTGLNKDKP